MSRTKPRQKAPPFTGRAADAFRAAQALLEGPDVSGRDAWALGFQRLAWELNAAQKGPAPDVGALTGTQTQALHDLAGALSSILPQAPRDLAGEIYMRLRLNDTGHEQVFTPHEAARFMVRSLLDGGVGREANDHHPMELTDPFGGSGVFALEMLAELQARGIPTTRLWMIIADIDPHCCDMAFVQYVYARGLGEVHNCDTFRTRDIRTTPITHIDMRSKVTLLLRRHQRSNHEQTL